MRRISMVVGVIGLAMVVAAPVAVADAPAYVATIQTADGQYRAVIRDPVMVEKARVELAGGEDAGVPIGPLAWGSGGVNRGHRWHVTELSFADVTIELCDGTARMVDQDPRYWIRKVGYFCPWSGRVIALTPLRRPDRGV